MSDINWTSDQQKLSDLTPWEDNPRQLTDKKAEDLQESIRKFGQVIPYSISPSGEIYDGHQRQHVMGMMEKYGRDCIVAVRVSSRVLTDDERRELVIRLHENTGEWDIDGLANLYDVEELEAWGFDKLDSIFVPDFQPVGEDEQPRLDQKAPIKCPHCGEEFVPA